MESVENNTEIVLGVYPYDFTNERREQVKGVSIFIGEKDSAKGLGYRCDKKSLTDAEFAKVFRDMSNAAKVIMKPVRIAYNRHGKPIQVEVLAQPQK